MAALGISFLTAAYLMVNQDTGQFTLWAANPTTKSDLVAVDANGADAVSFCTPGTDGDEDRSSSCSGGADQVGLSGINGPPSSDSSASGAGFPTVAIIGVAVGAVAVGAFIGVAVFWLLRRKKNKAEAAAAGTKDGSVPPQAGDGVYLPYHKGAGWVKAVKYAHETDGNPFSELPAHTTMDRFAGVRHELEYRKIRHELE